MAKAKRKLVMKTIEQKREELGGLLLECRNEKGLSIADLSNQVDIPHAVAHRLEHGTNKITLENAIRLADFFGLDIEDFVVILR
jgi:plasmid maintenance system antidote protein VapI